MRTGATSRPNVRSLATGSTTRISATTTNGSAHEYDFGYSLLVPRTSLAKEASEQRAGRTQTYVQTLRAKHPAASGVSRRRSRASPGWSRRRRGASMSMWDERRPFDADAVEDRG